MMAETKPAEPITFLGPKGPLDWKAHKRISLDATGMSVAQCADKKALGLATAEEAKKVRGRGRAITILPENARLYTACPICWGDGEWPPR